MLTNDVLASTTRWRHCHRTYWHIGCECQSLAYSVQAVCPDVPMFQWISVAVSVWTSPAGCQTWIKAKTEMFINLTTGRAVHTPLYRRWPAFAVAAPRAWNSLPDSLHKLSAFVNFKKHLKFYLFTNLPVQHHIWCEAFLRGGALYCLRRRVSCLFYLLTYFTCLLHEWFFCKFLGQLLGFAGVSSTVHYKIILSVRLSLR